MLWEIRVDESRAFRMWAMTTLLDVQLSPIKPGMGASPYFAKISSNLDFKWSSDLGMSSVALLGLICLEVLLKCSVNSALRLSLLWLRVWTILEC